MAASLFIPRFVARPVWKTERTDDISDRIIANRRADFKVTQMEIMRVNAISGAHDAVLGLSVSDACFFFTPLHPSQ